MTADETDGVHHILCLGGVDLTEGRKQGARENGTLDGMSLPYGTPEALEAKCQEYRSLCEAEDIFPDEAGMLLYLGLSRDMKSRYESREDGGFAEVFKKYMAIRESMLVRELFRNPRGASAYTFLLKQPENGGYGDKQQAESDDKSQLELVIQGV